MPDGPNATKGFSEQYFAPGVTEEFAQELIAFNKEVGAEDDVLIESVQRGLLGGIPDRGRFLTNSEHLVVHFQKLIVNAVSGQPAAPVGRCRDRAPAVSRTIPLLPDASAAPDSERNAYVDLEIFKIEPESEIISSFYLRRVDGKPLDPWEPGQFLPIRVTIPGQAQPALRTYTLSTTPNPDHYRLSIRRADGNALVSPYLHANARPGLRIEAMTPRGKFVLIPESDRPVVFVSGGVGITPMIAMANHLVEEGRRHGQFRPVWFIHGTNNGRVHAFGRHIRELAAAHPAMKVHVRYSQPGSGDRLGATHDGEGHITIDVLKELLPLDDYDFYLCGPPPFMQSLYDGLTGIGVRRDRIHYESFGSGTALKPEAKTEAPARIGPPSAGAVPIRFAKSAVTAEWSRDKGTLLELAEAVGLAPVFGCRSGICGTCATRITSGAVDYVEEPLAPRGEGQVLLCCSVPAGTHGPGRGQSRHGPRSVGRIPRRERRAGEDADVRGFPPACRGTASGNADADRRQARRRAVRQEVRDRQPGEWRNHRRSAARRHCRGRSGRRRRAPRLQIRCLVADGAPVADGGAVPVRRGDQPAYAGIRAARFARCRQAGHRHDHRRCAGGGADVPIFRRDDRQGRGRRHDDGERCVSLHPAPAAGRRRPASRRGTTRC